MKEKKRGFGFLILALYLLILIPGLLTAILFFVQPHSDYPFDSGRYITISDGVKYRKPDNSIIDLSLPSRVDLDANEEAMFYFQFPKDVNIGDYVFLYVGNFNVKIYAGNQCIGNYLGAGEYALGGDIPSEWYLIRLSKEYDYSNLYVRLSTGPSGYHGWLKNVYVGERSAVVFHLLRTYAFTIIADLILMIFGIIVCIHYFITFFRKSINNERYLCLGIAMIFLSLQMFFGSELRQILIQNVFMADSLAVFTIPITLIGVALYIIGMGRRMKKRSVITAVVFGVGGFFIDGLMNAFTPFGDRHIFVAIGMLGMAIALTFDIRDSVSEMRESEEAALRYNKERTMFLGRMSHAIRTPVNTISGMNSVILRETKNDELRSHAAEVKSAVGSLLSIIDDILDISRIESRNVHIERKKYDLMSLINDVHNMTVPGIEKKGLSFEIENDSSIPSFLFGDEVRIRQIITNLLSNAVKYTKEGKIRLALTFDPVSAESIMLHIKVSDTGAGIKPENLKTLFDPYTRADEEANRNIEGTGLGLSILHDLVTMMDGTIEVESNYGEGSVFTVSIPQDVAVSAPAGSYSGRMKIADARSGGEKWFLAPDATVLIVDDVEMNLDVMRALFNVSGIRVDTAGGGEEGLELIRQKRYDIIFLDHMMPSPDGIDTFDKMKTLSDNPNKDTPVIMLTANAVAGAKEDYLAMGFTDYISKPVSEHELIEKCRKYLPDSLIMDSVDTVIPSSEAAADPAGNALIESLSTILNTEIGLTNSLGKQEFYLKVLNSFLTNSQIDEMKTFYSARDMKNYKIHVHALKSSARLVGAEDISEKARLLEEASGGNDVGYVEANHDILITEFETLKAAAEEILQGADKKEEKPKKAFSKDKALALLDVIRKAVSEIDIEAMDHAVMMLKDCGLPDEYSGLMEKLAYEDEQIHFENVAALTEELGQKLSSEGGDAS